MATKKASAVKKLAKRGAVATSAASRRAEELLALIERRKQRISEDFFDIGVALREIERKKLYVALGFASFAALLEARKVMSERTARKLIEIVEAVPRGTAIDLGSEKAYALARLVATTPDLDSVDTVLAKGVRVRGKKTAVGKLSANQIEAVARKVRPKKERAGEKEARALARTVQASLRARGAPHATAEAIRRGSEWWITVSAPVGEAEAFPRAKK
ncbi:MAG: hypothetical protein ACXVEF_43185 [Polyangiales bacterium]